MDPRGQADGGAVLVALAEDVEQALASGLRQGDVSELVDDEQADLGELGLEAESLFSSRASISSWTRWEAVAKRTERPFWQAARRRARAMCVLPTPLGPSRITFSQRVMYSPRGEFEDQHLAEHRDGLEVEAFELFDDGEACLLDALLDQAALACRSAPAPPAGRGTGHDPIPRPRTAAPVSRIPAGRWQPQPLQVMLGQDARGISHGQRPAEVA